MKHGSLFSGLGGFDYAAQLMGWENVFHCEINPFCQKILSYYWPKATSYENIKTTDFTIHRGSIDILTGGFPCQPYSSAGKRLGKEDERHLWPEMLRAIREIQPRYIVGENVRGLLNWNGGVVFDEVQTDLENEGYEVLPFLLPAAGVNAPHERYRIWFVAFKNADRNGCIFGQPVKNGTEIRQQRYFGAGGGDWIYLRTRIDSNTKSRRLEKRNGKQLGKQEKDENDRKFSGLSEWQNFPTQSPVRSGNDGVSAGLDGITFPKWRNESIKAAGNAIVPQVALQIFKAIEQLEKTK